MSCTTREEITAAAGGAIVLALVIVLLRDPDIATKIIHILAADPNLHLEKLDKRLQQMAEENQQDLPPHLDPGYMSDREDT